MSLDFNPEKGRWIGKKIASLYMDLSLHDLGFHWPEFLEDGLTIEDSIESWGLTNLHTMLIHKSGGGTGYSGVRVRPSGDFVRGSYGIASGPLSVFNIINATTEEVKQGGTRRGANMGILPFNHPDIKKFISPLRDRRNELAKDPAAVLKILKDGGERAKSVAEKKMDEVREKVGVKLY